MDEPESNRLDCNESDPVFQRQIERLHQLSVMGRWLVIGVLWMLLFPPSLWALRHEIALWRQHFTWTAVRYGLAYNPVPTIALSLCIGLTVTTLIWQSHNILFGISQRQTRRLKNTLFRIRKQGNSHPLWRWVCENQNQSG